MSTPVAQRLRWATAVLADAGVESPRVDAELLLAAVTGTDRGRLLLVDSVDEDLASEFERLVSARAHRVPLQHLTGRAYFDSLELAVGPGVFTPRPETESVLEWSLPRLDPDRATVVVDLCSGSGALALAVARARPRAAVTAVELSDHALTWLRRNAAAVGPSVDVVAADATDPTLPERLGVSGSVDLVVANPPYIPLGVALPPEVVDHEPASALFGGLDGLAVIVPMIDVIAGLLADGGWCAVEHDDTTSQAVADAFRRTGHFESVEGRRDLTGRDRFVVARRAHR